MIPRRARPTLRVLQDDLRDGWESPHAPPRAGVQGLDPLSPLSALPHPIIRKAAESFGDDPEHDTHLGRIKSSTRLVMLEIKTGQWRGGVWVDQEAGVCWLIAAGLAKGGHKDHDDFYERVKRADSTDETERWLPTDDDRRQLKREAAATLSIEWECDIQRRIVEVLRTIASGGTATFILPHPSGTAGKFGECTLTVAEQGDSDFKYEEVIVEIDLASEFRTSELGWQATIRILTVINPPETGWDRVGDTYSTIDDIGNLALRLDQLQEITDRGELAQSHPNNKAHYAHRRSLAISSVVGLSVRSMCGLFFVPYQNHETLPKCQACEERYETLPE
ncbi:DUF3039 domain-containing protein [Catenuloplanes japonicus]|uniref:DUF3039 domain-containing protein n=1 Tax=Catenuloplanes japonicus TaxID=33876 RepID=UPI00068FBE9A|nr:DUF3039 domain-containing protein [Catenuloplanes japonicus]